MRLCLAVLLTLTLSSLLLRLSHAKHHREVKHHRHKTFLNRPLHLIPGAHYIDETAEIVPPAPEHKKKHHKHEKQGAAHTGKTGFLNYGSRLAAIEKDTKFLQGQMQRLEQGETSEAVQPFTSNKDYQVIRNGLKGQRENLFIQSSKPLQGVDILDQTPQRQASSLPFQDRQLETLPNQDNPLTTVLQSQNDALTQQAADQQAQSVELSNNGVAFQSQGVPLSTQSAASILQAQANPFVALQSQGPLAALQAQANTLSTLQAQTNPLTAQTQANPLTSLQSQANTLTSLQAQTNPLAALQTQANSLAVLQAQANSLAALQTQSSAYAGQIAEQAANPGADQNIYLNSGSTLLSGQQALGSTGSIAGLTFSQPITNQYLPGNVLSGVTGLRRDEVETSAPAISLDIDGFKSSFVRAPGQQGINLHSNNAVITVSKKTRIAKSKLQREDKKIAI